MNNSDGDNIGGCRRNADEESVSQNLSTAEAGAGGSCCCRGHRNAENGADGPSSGRKENSRKCCHGGGDAADTEKPACCCGSEGGRKGSCGKEGPESENKKCCCHCQSGGDSSAAGKVHGCCGCSGEKSKRVIGEGAKLWISAFSLLASLAVWQFEIPWPGLPYTDPSWLAVLLCALPIYKSAFNSLVKERRITSALLVSSAMTAAFVLQILSLAGFDSHGVCSESYILVVAEIAFLMALGEWIEERTIRKSRSGIEALGKLMPRTALVKRGGEIGEVQVSEVSVGDIVCVRPDSMFPVDGVVVNGSTSVDESNMTGESIPVDKACGDSVLGGTLNISGYTEVRATSPADESALSKLVKIVEEAEGKKAPISRVADRWASRIVPAAIITSILVFLCAYFVFGIYWMEALVRAATILVVFCPCAFVLATPTAVAAGLGNAAKRGVLIKSGAAMEKMASVDSVYFDKTGTLTKGLVRVNEVFSYELGENELLRYAACAEAMSTHPIARAITEYAKLKGAGAGEVSQMRSLAGLGVEAVVGGVKVEVSKFDSGDESLSPCRSFAEESFNSGRTVACVKAEGKFIGAFALSDTPRESSAEAVGSLSASGYGCAMLSGDNFQAASAVAKSLGISKVFAPLRPEEKQGIIRAAQEKGEKICFVGDGVNDAPALALADVSVAIADLKNDIAVETAEVSLIGADLRKIPAMLRFSKSVMRTIKGNIVFSICFNFCAILLALFGFLSPVGGAILHNASSVIVVLNSARLLKKK